MAWGGYLAQNPRVASIAEYCATKAGKVKDFITESKAGQFIREIDEAIEAKVKGWFGREAKAAPSSGAASRSTLSDAPLFQVGAKNTADGVRLNVDLKLKENGILTLEGHLSQEAVAKSRVIELSSGKINNPSIVRGLTADGSSILDWRKCTTPAVELSTGQRVQVHYYMNIKTGKIDYTTKDFKIKGTIK